MGEATSLSTSDRQLLHAVMQSAKLACRTGDDGWRLTYLSQLERALDAIEVRGSRVLAETVSRVQLTN